MARPSQLAVTPSHSLRDDSPATVLPEKTASPSAKLLSGSATKAGPAHRKSKVGHVRRFLTDSLLWEWLAMVVSIGALAAIGIVLGIYDGKPLHQWSHTIQLNTVLSTLATTLKGFMLISVCACLGQWKWLWCAGGSRALAEFDLFDGASRGPLGSLQLLSSLRLRVFHVACLGAVIFLISLFSDIFIQQSVSYPLRAVNSTISAGIPYASVLSNSAMHYDTNEIDPALRLALYDGMFSRNLTSTSSSITPVCPTGNCTFPAYASLAVCSHCQDVSSLVINATEIRDEHDNFWNFTLPNGLAITGDSAQVVYNPIIMSNSVAPNTKALDPWLHNYNIVFTSIMIWKGPGYGPESTVEAADCTLSFCAKAYTAEVVQGQFTENVTAIVDQPQWVGRFDQINADLVPYIHFDVSHEEMPLLDPNFTRTFSLGSKIFDHLQLQYVSYFDTDSSITDLGLIIFQSDIDAGFYWNGPHAINETMANVADAMTNAIRGLSDLRYEGTASTVESFIKVTWLWLLLPLIMLILAIAFLALTMRQSHVSDVPHWRNSALAVMEHGIDTIDFDEGRRGHDGQIVKNAFEMASGKEETSILDEWADQARVRLRRRGERGEGFGLVYV